MNGVDNGPELEVPMLKAFNLAMETLIVVRKLLLHQSEWITAILSQTGHWSQPHFNSRETLCLNTWSIRFLFDRFLFTVLTVCIIATSCKQQAHQRGLHLQKCCCKCHSSWKMPQLLSSNDWFLTYHRKRKHISIS